MLKIVTIIGARPQFVKAAVVSREIAKRAEIEELIVHTGQHYDANMSDVFFKEMDIPKPNYFLDINGLAHGAMTGQMLEKIEQVLLNEKPDYVLVYGDTNSTVAGALAASKLHIPIAHVEAGLRSFNMKMPEEINRILTDRISSILFCPTETSVMNLKKEGFENLSCQIDLVGDVMYDAALYYKEKAKKLKDGINQDDYVLCTIHRQENTDSEDNLKSIFGVMNEIGQDVKIVLPLHPRTQKFIQKYSIKINPDNIHIIEPVGYLEMVGLIKNALYIMTDSGGLQKEAYFFQKYCITLREETEWVELIENKVNFLCGSDAQKILNTFSTIQKLPSFVHTGMYGNGDAGKKIVDKLLNSKN